MNIKYQFLSALLIINALLVAPLQTMAQAPATHRYFLDEPVFHGRANIIEAGNPNKPMIVLVHGLGDRAADTWRRVIPDLSRDFFVVTFDLPGFGRSAKGNHLYSPENYARFIHYVVKKYRKDRFILVGHSMGGNIALRYAATYPEQVDRLMLIDAAGVLHRLAYVQFLTHYGIKILPQFYHEQSGDLNAISSVLLEPLLENAGLMEMGEQMILNQPTLRETVLGGEPSTIAAYAMIMSDYSEVLQNISVPTLIVWGERDTVTPLRTGKVLAHSMPNAGLYLFSNAGHNPVDEQAQRFDRLLKDFTGADQAGLAKLLAAYRLPRKTEQTRIAYREIDCLIQPRQVISGSFSHLRVSNCQDILLTDIDAHQLSISNSQVRVENCELNSNNAALEAVNSRLELTACRITGKPAVQLRNTDLDAAGVQVISDGDAVMNISVRPTNADASVSHSKLLFSVSRISSQYMQKFLHGPLSLKPGEGL